MYKRLLSAEIQNHLFQGKILFITGARQTGKTTLVKKLLASYPKNTAITIINCDDPVDRELLNNRSLSFLTQLFDPFQLVFIDEGQKVATIGQTLKLLVDHYQSTKQFIVSGSSSFNLLDQTQETLTGRKRIFNLYPLCLTEIFPDKNIVDIQKNLEQILIFGSYPEVINNKSFSGKIEALKEITSSYLYRDILEFQKLKNPAILTSLLKALSLQIGSEVSYTELSSHLGIDKKTIEQYIDLLEKSYIIFRLSPFTSNRRRELSKLRKIYFYDLGIRNAIINNFNLLENRNDAGVLFENLMITERLKFRSYRQIYANCYFWRTYDGSEIDLVEDREGKLFGYEFKLGTKISKRVPKSWLAYPSSSYKIINKDNLPEFLL